MSDLISDLTVSPKKRSRKASKEGAKKLIPPHKTKGRRTAKEEAAIRWICALAESVDIHISESIDPVVSLPCLEVSSGGEKTDTVQLGIKNKTVEEKDLTPLTSPPVQSTIQSKGIPKNSSNGVHEQLPEVELWDNPQKVIHQDSDLERDVLLWLEGGFRRYIRMAGRRDNMGPWAHRLAQVAAGLDVMARGSEWVGRVFEAFTGAMVGLFEAARDSKDLESLSYIMRDIVYLDLLAEIANFKTKHGHVSTNLQGCYEDKMLSF